MISVPYQKLPEFEKALGEMDWTLIAFRTDDESQKDLERRMAAKQAERERIAKEKAEKQAIEQKKREEMQARKAEESRIKAEQAEKIRAEKQAKR